MTLRKRLTPSRRVAILDRHEQTCHICGGEITTSDKWHLEHIKPLWLGGEDEEDNLAPAHTRCHAEKTAEEAGARAKSDRVRNKAWTGRTKARKGRPMPGGKDSGWKCRLTSEGPKWERRT
jgi:Restriction endonuclease